MQSKEFIALDYQRDQSFHASEYRYQGNISDGWHILRNGETYLKLGPGFELVKTLHCGICATDLARHHLPFPLPQVTGHEVVGEYAGRHVALEINISHWHRQHGVQQCWYCRNGFANFCPQRLTLGIDRLPGGFAPWVLVPRRCLHELPTTIPANMGIILEPLAAAIRAVTITPPENGQRVAVLGLGRLGLLLVAALENFRQRSGIKFEIFPLSRQTRYRELSLLLGGDEFVQVTPGESEPDFDIVFDTSGTPQGFTQALAWSKKIVHLKSTHGQAVLGLENLTRLVINEFALKPYVAMAVKPAKEVVMVSPPAFTVVPGINGVNEFLAAPPAMLESSLRPGGTIMVQPNPQDQSLLSQALCRGYEIHSSRCGSFQHALELLLYHPDLMGVLAESYITHDFPVADLAQAFNLANSCNTALKIRVNHEV